MKAVLLAAGAGVRLRPLTDGTPKCLLEFGGRSLLDRWLDACAGAGVDEVLVNLHHLADAVRSALGSRRGAPTVRTVLEPELLGSAGTLRANRRWLEHDDVFLVCNADNLTDFDLRDLLAFHRRGGTHASVVAFRAGEPSACGILDVDPAGRMVGFAEKPRRPRSNLANAGIYAFHPAVLDELRGRPPLDIAYDLLPTLVGEARVMEFGGYLLDVGTPSAYRRARLEWGGAPVR